MAGWHHGLDGHEFEWAGALIGREAGVPPTDLLEPGRGEKGKRTHRGGGTQRGLSCGEMSLAEGQKAMNVHCRGCLTFWLSTDMCMNYVESSRPFLW